jgi:diaminopimelate epimerase
MPQVDVRARELDAPALARAVCDRHRGIGADGLGLYEFTDAGAVMRLLNADGSPSEVSGNGVRCLATIVARERGLTPGTSPVVSIRSDAGDKHLTLLAIEKGRYRFRAAMGVPEHIREVTLTADGDTVRAVALTMGNPQCVVVGGPLTEERLARFGPVLQHDPLFPEGVNFELATVEAPNRIRILIWERGVGPTWSSGTGSCASAIACAVAGGAARDVTVHAPGGSQRVEWTDAGVFLTGEARVVLDGAWVG